MKNWHAFYRLLVSLCIALPVFIMPPEVSPSFKLMMVWDVFAFIYLAISWSIIAGTGAEQIRNIAAKEDNGSTVIFIVVIFSSITSLFSVLLLIKGDGTSWRIIPALGVILSWVLMHTLFAMRYAHLYYGDHKHSSGEHSGGLNIPGTTLPGYSDFTYFSFVLGMTYQVSDIQITSKPLRKLALLHSLLSFAFNTVIIALAVSEVLNH